MFINNSSCGDIQTRCRVSTAEMLFLPSTEGIYCCVFGRSLHPLRANSTAALSKLHDIISAQETVHPDAVFIAAGDFSHCNLKTVFSEYYQPVDIPSHD